MNPTELNPSAPYRIALSSRYKLTHVRSTRVALAFENLTPRQVCDAFTRALNLPCNYVFDPQIEVKVGVPNGYRQQLLGLEVLFGQYNAPYFAGPDFQHSGRRKDSNDTITGRNSSESPRGKPGKLTDLARTLWPGWRSLSEYFATAFLVEEEANGKTWMVDKTQST